MRCLAEGQLPLWLPDLNAGFGSPGLRLYSPLGPVISGALGLLLGDVGRGLRAAALASAAGVLLVALWRTPSPNARHALVLGSLVLLSPMVVFSLLGRTAWSEFLAVPFAWWVLERSLEGGVRFAREGVVVALLWLAHAPTALMVALLVGLGLLWRMSRNTWRRWIQVASVSAALTAWHWLPLLQETKRIGSGERLTGGIFEPARNVLGSPTAHGASLNAWCSVVAIALLVSILVSRSWREDGRRTFLVVACVFLASPLAVWLWRLETPLQLLQFPARLLLPATLILMPVLVADRSRRLVALTCLLAPLLLLPSHQWLQLPRVTADLEWQDMGEILVEQLGANPFLVDAEQNRPPSFEALAGNLAVFGGDRVVTFPRTDLVRVDAWGPLRRRVEVATSSPVTVGFRILDYPFWSVTTADGSAAADAGIPGVVSCRLPPGRHQIEISWTGNPRAAVGQLVAGLTLAILVVARRIVPGDRS